MIGFIRNTDRRILLFLGILSIMFIFAPGDTARLLVGILADIFALFVELRAWLVEFITLSSGS